jgi:hypothetical protein
MAAEASNRARQSRSLLEAESAVYEIRGINTYADFVLAINTANNDPASTYVIYMLPGVYTTLPQTAQGLDILGNVVIVGNLAAAVNDPAVLDSDKVIFQPSSGKSIFHIADGSLTFYNIVLQGGGATASANSGGAIASGLSPLFLYDSLLRDNRTTRWGGAIYSQGSVTTINTVFDYNSATSTSNNTGGGAVALQYSGASLHAECTTFKNNHAQAYGGAIFIYGGTAGLSLWHDSDPLRSNNFESNQATRGYGAIYNLDAVSENATNQWWSPPPSTVITAVNSVNRADYTPTLGAEVALNCAFPPIPTPTWSSNGVKVDPSQPIPPLVIGNFNYECVLDPLDSRYDGIAYRDDCALEAYVRFLQQLQASGEPMTWANLISLVIAGEGGPIMLGRIENGTLVYNNPQMSYPGSTCWRWNTTTNNWQSGTNECSPGIQRHFPWAVTELVFNVCSQGLGFPGGGIYTKPDNTQYDGYCNEQGFINYIASVPGLYREKKNRVEKGIILDPNLYVERAEYELPLWSFSGEGELRSYGECPCSWENTNDLARAQSGSSEDGTSFSYFEYPPDADPNTYQYAKYY